MGWNHQLEFVCFLLFFFAKWPTFVRILICNTAKKMQLWQSVTQLFPSFHVTTTMNHVSTRELMNLSKVWEKYESASRKAGVGGFWVVVSNIFIFNPIWGRFPVWLIFFKWVETVRCVWSKCWFIETQSSTSRWLQESLDAFVIWERFYHGWYGKRCELGFCLSIARAPMCEQGFLPRSKRFRAW